jgi:hypothetical protein
MKKNSSLQAQPNTSVKNLGKSNMSAEGFMGKDTRTLEQIIADDKKEMKRIGVSKKALVKALKEVYEKARAALGAEVEVRPGVRAVFHESMGRIPSPFSADGLFEKGEAVVTHRQTRKTIIISRLALSLIEKHDFFQGKGSRYRIDPGEAAEMFGLGQA